MSLLSYGEITSVSTIDGLRGLYDNKGISFDNQYDFLKHFSVDWEMESKRIREECKAIEVTTFPYEDVEVEGVRYRLFGIDHGWHLKTYYDLLQDQLSDDEPILVEQGLKRFLGEKQGIEMLDHVFLNCDSIRVALRRHMNPKAFYERIMRLTNSEGLTNDFLSYLNQPSHVRGSVIVSGTLGEDYYEGSSFPKYILLEMGWREGIKYQEVIDQEANCINRSAYMAAFARAYKPEEDKSIIMGALHQDEITYFLQHPEKIGPPGNMAREHANSALDLEEYKDLTKQIKKQYQKELYARLDSCLTYVVAGVGIPLILLLTL